MYSIYVCVYILLYLFQDGVHQTEDDTPKYTDEQLKLMKSQDIKYVNFKRSSELKVTDVTTMNS